MAAVTSEKLVRYSFASLREAAIDCQQIVDHIMQEAFFDFYDRPCSDEKYDPPCSDEKMEKLPDELDQIYNGLYSPLRYFNLACKQGVATLVCRANADHLGVIWGGRVWSTQTEAAFHVAQILLSVSEFREDWKRYAEGPGRRPGRAPEDFELSAHEKVAFSLDPLWPFIKSIKDLKDFENKSRARFDAIDCEFNRALEFASTPAFASEFARMNGEPTEAEPTEPDTAGAEPERALNGEAQTHDHFTVTLSQAAAVVNKSKRTLERWAQNDPCFPMPDIDGGGGKANEWRWSKLRPYLESKTGRELPERHPSDRLRPNFGAVEN